MSDRHDEFGCGCDGCDRREFLTTMGAAAGSIAFTSFETSAAVPSGAKETTKAAVRVAFLYRPSGSFAGTDGWWSWPGNEFDAEGRHKQFAAAFREMETRLGIKLTIDETPIATDADAQRLAGELESGTPDGLVLVMFYNRSLGHADVLLKAAEKAGVPAVFYIGLGVKHGPVSAYRRPGVYFIQSLDNFEALEYGLRMIQTRKRMAQTRLLSITDVKERKEATEAFFGTTIRAIPFAEYAKKFQLVTLDAAQRQWIDAYASKATEVRSVSREALDNAARAHVVLLEMLKEEQADGVMMTCLKQGMLKPCMSFASLNSQLIPAACENDMPAALTQRLGQLLTGRPGFQHNPAFETERNHYYASHCTCPTKIYGPDGPELSYLLRRFAHTNEGSCAIQAFWKELDPVTIVRYYPGKTPALDVYAGRVVKSHPMPPAGGCTTNAEVEILDRPDACMVAGHHNLMFCGDFARKFRLFAQLYKIRMGNAAFKGTEPV